MALLTYADRVAETTTTTGTGTIQLGGAVDGKFRTFVAGAGSGNTVPYVLVHRTANEWEVGYGVVTSGSPDTLTRAGVYSSSNGGAAVNFSAGTKDVFLGLPAGKTVTFDDTTGAVTIASATVSGDLTVDTDTLKVDSANNRVGIGTTSPGQLLDVEASASVAQLRSTSTTAANAPRLRFNHAGNDSFDLRGGDGLSFLASATTEVMRIDASGNLGLGVTPQVWNSTYDAIQIGAAGNINSRAVGSGIDNIDIGVNWYRDAGGNFVRTSAGPVSSYVQGGGEHSWYNAATGTAGSTFSFTQAMTLDASGNLLVGTTSAASLASFSGSATGQVIQGAVPALVIVDDGDTTNYRAFIGNSSGTMFIGNVANAPMVFSTNNTERARITSGGYFKASNDGTYNGSADAYHEMRAGGSGLPVVALTQKSSTNPDGIYLGFTAAAPDNNTQYFLHCLDNVTSRCYIWSDGDLANHDGVYGTISDERLKQDIVDASSQWDDLKAIRFRKYRFKSDVEQKGEDAPYLLGVVAQELREVSPGLVDAHPDTEQVEVEVEVEKTRPVMHDVEEIVTDAEGVESVVTKSVPKLDADGQPVTETYTETETRTETRQTGTETLSVKSSILLMKAAVALQEAMARIETLEARLAALEAK